MEKIKKENIVDYLRALMLTIILPVFFLGNVNAQQLSLAEKLVSSLGAENAALKLLQGNFDVKETIWSSPTSIPVYNTKLIARRRMIGSVLQEFMYAAPGTANSPVERIEYISFNRIEGRWRSISMDIRVPVGLMPAASFDRGQESKIRLIFDPFAIAGKGSSVTGQMLRMDETINFEDPDHVIKEQHFVLADGSGKSWLAHRYEYTKRK